jgi:spermidine/putrescine transport system substrate-binding protein
MEFVKPEVKAVSAVFPDAEKMKTLKMLRILPSEIRLERGRLWTEVKVK